MFDFYVAITLIIILTGSLSLSILFQCGMVDNVIAAKILIGSGADTNSRDKELWTPLHIASAFSRLEIVQLLLEVWCAFVNNSV